MIHLIVESEKTVSRQLHGERRTETLAPIASEKKCVTHVAVHFRRFKPDIMQRAGISNTEIDALSGQRMHRVSSVTDHNHTLRHWVGGTKLASLSSCCASALRIGKAVAAVAASDPAIKVRRLVVTVFLPGQVPILYWGGC